MMDYEAFMKANRKIASEDCTLENAGTYADCIFDYLNNNDVSENVKQFGRLVQKRYGNMITLYVFVVNRVIKSEMKKINLDSIEVSTEAINKREENSSENGFIKTYKPIYNEQIELVINEIFKKLKKEVIKFNDKLLRELKEKNDNANYIAFLEIAKEIGNIIIEESFSEKYEDDNPGSGIFEKIHLFLDETNNDKRCLKDADSNEQPTIRKNQLIQYNRNSILQYYELIYELSSLFKEVCQEKPQEYTDRIKLRENNTIKINLKNIESLWNGLNLHFYKHLLYEDLKYTDNLFVELCDLFPTAKYMSVETTKLDKFMFENKWAGRRLRVAGTKFFYLQYNGDKYNYAENFKNFVYAVIGNEHKLERTIELDTVSDETRLTKEDIDYIFSVGKSFGEVFTEICESNGRNGDKKYIKHVRDNYPDKVFKHRICEKENVIRYALYAHATVKQLDLLMSVSGYCLSKNIKIDKFTIWYFTVAELHTEMYSEDRWEYELSNIIKYSQNTYDEYSSKVK